jgi:hypothetical protein
MATSLRGSAMQTADFIIYSIAALIVATVAAGVAL